MSSRFIFLIFDFFKNYKKIKISDYSIIRKNEVNDSILHDKQQGNL